MHISDMLIFLNAVLINSVPVDTQKTAKDSINTGFVIKSCKEQSQSFIFVSFIITFRWRGMRYLQYPDTRWRGYQVLINL